MNPNPDIFPNAPEAGDGGTDAPASELPPNPFVGLRPFDTSESLLFFGRDEQTTELLQQLDRGRFLAVIGSSGCGKSSLIRAGLIPKLKGGFLVSTPDQWRFAKMKPGKSPILNLAAALLEACGEDVKQSPQLVEPLAQRIRLAGAQAITEHLSQRLGARAANVLLLVDQFEEIFRFGFHADEGEARETPGEWKRRRDEAADFVSIMLELSRQDSFPVYVVITMRSDFLSDCDEFYGLPQAINRGLYLVPRLTRRQRMEAVACPIRLYGEEISPGLLDRVLNDMGVGPEQAPKGKDEETDELPVMQHAMMRTWEDWFEESKRRGGVEPGPIDLRHYENVGTIKGALSKDADAALDSLSAEEQEIAVLVFQALTDTDARGRRLRRPARLSELTEIAGLPPDSDAVERIIERFRSNNRLFIYLSEERLGGDTPVDISHESLIRRWVKLSEWVDAEAASKDQYLRLVGEALLYQRGKTSLLRDPALQLALDWWKERRPNETWARRYHPDFLLAEKYLDDSRREREAEAARTEAAHQQELEQTRAVAEQRRVFNRRLTWAVAALIVLLLLTGGAAVFALNASARAIESEKRALKSEAETKKSEAETKAAKDVIERQKNDLESDQKNLQTANDDLKTALGKADAATKAALDAQGRAEVASAEAKRQAAAAVREKKTADDLRDRAQTAQEADTQNRLATKWVRAVGREQDEDRKAEMFKQALAAYDASINKYQQLGDLDAVASVHTEAGQVLTQSGFSVLSSDEAGAGAARVLLQGINGILGQGVNEEADASKPVAPDWVASELLNEKVPPHKRFLNISLSEEENLGLDHYARAINIYRRLAHGLGGKAATPESFNDSAAALEEIAEVLNSSKQEDDSENVTSSPLEEEEQGRTQAAVYSLCAAVEDYRGAQNLMGQVSALTGIAAREYKYEMERRRRNRQTSNEGDDQTATPEQTPLAGCPGETADAVAYYEKTIPLYDQLIRQSASYPKPVAARKSERMLKLVTIARIYHERKDERRALEEVKAATLFDPDGAAAALRGQGDSEDGEELKTWYYERAVDAFHAAGDVSAEANVLASIGRRYLSFAVRRPEGQREGAYLKAIDYLQRSLPLYAKLDTPAARADQARALISIGSAYNTLNRMEDSLTAYKSALEFARAAGNKMYQGRALYGIARYQEKAGLSKEETLETYRSALKLSVEAHDTLYRGSSQAAIKRLTSNDLPTPTPTPTPASPVEAIEDDARITLGGESIGGTRPTGEAELEVNDKDEREFKVRVNNVNLPPGVTQLKVLVDGRAIGNITLRGDHRRGKLKLKYTKSADSLQINTHTRVVVADAADDSKVILAGSFNGAGVSPCPPTGP